MRIKVFILEDDVTRVNMLLVWLRGADLTVAKSCTEVDKFQPPYDLILLDHDLGGRQMKEHEDCGLTFLRLIKDKIDPDDSVVVFHSYNPCGAENMYKELNRGV